MANKRVLIRPEQGLYALTPKQLELLIRISLQATGEEEPKTFNITIIDKVLYTISEGKEVLPKGKAMKKSPSTPN